jgi:hypothetical protein
MSTYYLSPAGSDSSAGSAAAPWRTLSKAAAAVSGGDEVVLRAGTYSGGVTFDDPNLLIRSYAGERAVISSPTSSSSVQQAVRLGTGASGTTLRGLEVVGGYYYAVKLESAYDKSTPGADPAARNVTIEDCVLHGSGQDVVKVTPDCNDVVIRRNEIFGSGQRDGSNAEGIDNVNADRMLVQDTYIHDIATTGIYPKGGASGVVVERNRFENLGRSGVELGFYTDAEWFDADNARYYENIDGVVRNNVIVGARYAGVGMYGALRPQVYNNTLVNVATSGHAGILFAPAEVSAPEGSFVTPSRDARVFNNIVVTGGRPAVQVRAGGLDGTLTIDNNRYRSTAGSATFRDERVGFAGGLAAWRSRVGGDVASTEGDPLLDADEHLTASSPAIDAGRDLSSTGFANDVDRQSRPSGRAWDVGADEYVGATDPAPPPDTTAPAISGTAASGVSQAGATVAWTTDEPATSQVQFGTTTDYGTSTPLDASLVTSHSVALTGLAAGTSYHYRVLSRDAAGNLATSGDYVLTTPAAPTPPPATQFSPVEYSGDFANYGPLTASRWQVTTESSGEKRLTINTSAYDAPAEDLLGEYALLKGQAYGDFDLSLRAKSNESLSSNPSADYVVVFGYQDPNNYAYLMMSGRAANTRFFRVTNGVPSALPAAASAGIRDANWHGVTVSRRGSTVTVSLDGARLLSTTDARLGASGGVGVGSYNDAASFDDVAVTAPVTTAAPAALADAVPLSGGSVTKEVLV